MKRTSRIPEQNLTASELTRIQRSLRRRFRSCGVIEVGFGTAQKNGKQDSARGLTVCLFVRNKRMPRNTDFRIGRCINVWIRRNGKRRQLSLPTDVIQFRLARRSGVHVRAIGSSNTVNGGLVVSWIDSVGPRWGIVTVGHVFADTILNARVRVDGVGNRPNFAGELIWRSSDRRFDAALVEVAADDLIDGGLIRPFHLTSPNSFPIRPLDELRLDATPVGVTGSRRGQSLSDDSGEGPAFRVEHFFPELGPGIIEGVSKLDNVIRVRSDEPAPGDEFIRGTSGSVWLISGQGAAVQVAGLPPSWSVGFGQSIATVLAIVENSLPVSASQFKLVRAF